MNKKIIILFLIAFFIRLVAINQSLWLDEAISARVVKDFSFHQIINQFSPFDFHPPFYYLFLKLWTNFFGYSEISLRLPSVFFSLISAWFIYLSTKLFKNQKTGFWAAAFFLFNPLIVYYSQEARMYLMATMFVSIGFYFFIKNRQYLLSKDFLLMNLFFLLAFYTFYGVIFFIVSFFVFFIYKKKYQAFLFSFLIFIFGFFLITPLLSQQLINSQISLNNVRYWSLVLGKADLKNLLLIPVKFAIGRISFYPKWFYWLVAGVWTAFVFLSFIKVFLKNKKVFFNLGLFFILPLVLGFLFSFFKPMLQYFRFIYLIIVLSIGLALIDDLKIKKIIVVGFLFFSLVYLLFPQFYREDWKKMAEFIQKNKIKKVFIIKTASDPLIYYYHNKFKVLDIKEICNKEFNLKEKNIFVIPYAIEIWGIDYKRCLKEKKFHLFFEKNFNQLKFEQWVGISQK